eukprot:m51a1_g10344 putative calcium calmodulin-dependent 3 -cyclic nucleotide phosphodiesterase 1a isoform x2 (1777) ;mRNA; r:145162-155784
MHFLPLLALVALGAAADTITLASAYPPGGETTLYAQTIAKYLAYHSGLNVNVTFVIGGNGALALRWLAEQPADGLHIATAQTPFVVTLPMFPGCPYSLSDISVLSWSSLTPYVLMVHVNASYTTWLELLGAAAAARGLWVAGVSRPFVHQSIAAQCPEAKWLRFLQTDSSATNIKLLRNRSVAAIWGTPPLYMMNRDLMRPILVGADVTPETLPRVPLFSEYGIDITETMDRGLAVSSRLPEDVKRRLSGWIGDAAANVSFIREMQSLGFLPRWIAYPQTTKYMELKYAYYHEFLFPANNYDYTWVAATVPSVAGLVAVLAVVVCGVALYSRKRRMMFEQFEKRMSEQALQRQSPATTVLATLLELKKFVPSELQPRLTETTQLLVSASLNKVDITKGVDREAAVFFKGLIGIDYSGSNDSTADDASMSTCSTAGLRSSAALGAQRGEPWSLRHYDAVVASGDKYFLWNYDPREADREYEGHALQAMLVVFFERMGLLEAMRVERGTLCRWAEAVEDTYAGGNPFHSQLHAADVVQCVGYLVALPGLRGIITPQQAFLCIVAAAAHDCGHPGRTNAFVVESRGELAMTYNDRSVLENHHLATFFRLCAAKRQNIFGGVPDSEYRSLRRRVIEMVLATDLAGHFAFVDNLSNKLAVRFSPSTDPEDMATLLSTLLKARPSSLALAAPHLSNSARPWEVSEWWTQQISEEFFQQGDEELRRGFKVSAFMDRRCPRIPRSQVLFIDNIQMKIWKLLSQIEPVPELIELIQKNRDEWDLRDRRVSISTSSKTSGYHEGQLLHRAMTVPMRALFIGIIVAGSLAIAGTSIIPLSVEWHSSITSFASVSRSSIDTQAGILRRLVIDKARDAFAKEIARPVQFIETVMQRLQFSGVDITAIPSLHTAALASPFLFSLGLPEIMRTPAFSTFTFTTDNDQGHHMFAISAVTQPYQIKWGVYDQHERNSSYTISLYNTTTFKPTNITTASTLNFPITKRPYWPAMANKSRPLIWSMIYDTAARTPKPFYVKRIPGNMSAFVGALHISFSMKWLTDYFGSLRITKNSFAMVFQDTGAMNLVAVTEGTVVTPDGLSTYTVAGHPNATVRAPVERWLALTGGARRELAFTADDQYHDVSLLAVPEGSGWWMLLMSPISDFTGDVLGATTAAEKKASSSMVTVVVIVSVLVLAMCAAIVVVVTAVTHQIRLITRHLSNLSEMKFDSKCPDGSSVLTELHTMLSTAHQMTVALESFSVYVPKTVVHWLIRNNKKPELTMKQKMCTVMFLDVVQFTSTMEEHSVSVVFGILQTMFETFSAILLQNQATIDKYIGDAIMAIWNVPDHVKEHQMLACKSAVEICEALDQLNVEFEKLIGKKMAIRIGINSGPVFCGNVGSMSRMNYTVIGDTVNMAARLEAINKDIGSTVCISDSVRENCKGAVATRCLGSVPLKGFKELIRVHEIMGFSDRLSMACSQVLANYRDVERDLMAGTAEPDALFKYMAENPAAAMIAAHSPALPARCLCVAANGQVARLDRATLTTWGDALRASRAVFGVTAPSSSLALSLPTDPRAALDAAAPIPPDADFPAEAPLVLALAYGGGSLAEVLGAPEADEFARVAANASSLWAAAPFQPAARVRLASRGPCGRAVASRVRTAPDAVRDAFVTEWRRSWDKCVRAFTRVRDVPAAELAAVDPAAARSVEMGSAQAYTAHMVLNPGLLLANRDFCLLVYERREPGGGLTIVARSAQSAAISLTTRSRGGAPWLSRTASSLSRCSNVRSPVLDHTSAPL